VKSPAEPFVVTTADKITTVLFNKLDRRNAFDRHEWDSFVGILRSVDEDENSNVVVVTGAGSSFSAGGDIRAMGRSSASAAVRVRHEGLDLFNALLHMEKPTIAMVNGPAVGLGATIALLCDFAFMSESAFLCDTHVPLGLVAGDGAIVAATLLCGPNRAKELAMRGSRLTGTQAAQLGLINGVVAHDQLEGETYAFARELAEQPVYAVRATKLAINQHLHDVAMNTIETVFAFEALSAKSAGHADAVKRFQAVASRSSNAAGGS
jgi:enoyl-CoA hydratase